MTSNGAAAVLAVATAVAGVVAVQFNRAVPQP